MTIADWIRRIATHKRDGAEDGSAFRKCPACGERDFRMSDRQRQSPEIYGSRTFTVKWLCLACGAREVETVEEPFR